MISLKEISSPRNIHASTAICISIVPFIMLDSIAVKVLSVKFQIVNAKAVFTMQAREDKKYFQTLMLEILEQLFQHITI